MKRFFTIFISTIMLFFTMSCSILGDIGNCATNAIGCGFELIGKFNGCGLIRCTVCFSTCGICGSFGDCGCYDYLTGYTCMLCAESARSTTCSDDSHILGGQDETEYRINSSNSITSIEKILETGDYANGTSYFRIKASVLLNFETFGDNVKFDNVSVVCTLKYKGKTIESTRWIGSANSKKSYTVKPEFYLDLDKTQVSSDIYEKSNFTIEIKVYGEKK